MDIWQHCKDSAKHHPLRGNLIRVVESQEQVATNNLVETLDEQFLLEEMLESNKPDKKNKHSLHYLLATPFRYPPLRHGSRFGSRSEPSLFYGSLNITTALSETAYYRLMFWRGIKEPPPSTKFTTQHTIFGTRYYTTQGIALHAAPFDQYHTQLSDPGSYQSSQQLGKQLRQLNTQAIEFISARDKTQGINVGLFTSSALADKLPTFQQQWLCETNGEGVAFYSASKREVHQFDLEQFLVNGTFPIPKN